jgi:hypothetical protein
MSRLTFRGHQNLHPVREESSCFRLLRNLPFRRIAHRRLESLSEHFRLRQTRELYCLSRGFSVAVSQKGGKTYLSRFVFQILSFSGGC